MGEKMRPKESIRVHKKEIVLAAVEVVGNYGMQALTIAAIAETARMSKTNFYRHFGGKEEIFYAIADYIGAAITGKAAAIAMGSRKPLEKLEAIFFSHMSLVAKHPGIPRFVYSEDVHLSDRKLADTVAFLIGNYVKIVSAIVAVGVAEGQLKQDLSPRETALTFIGMIQFTALRWTISGASFDKQVEAQKLWRNFLQLAI
jgi:AcrR family transcriptional regulator